MNNNYNIEFNDDENQVPEKESFNLNVTDREERDTEPSTKPIHKSMIISEVVDEHPDVIPLLIENGMHCIGCGASMFETLEEGFIGHGMDDREIDRIVDDINKFINPPPKKEEDEY
jgi:hybrid cluster-associated redox disulfide protein